MSVSDGATAKRVERLAVQVERIMDRLDKELEFGGSDRSEQTKNWAAALTDTYSVFHTERTQLEVLLEDEEYHGEGDGDDPVDTAD